MFLTLICFKIDVIHKIKNSFSCILVIQESFSYFSEIEEEHIFKFFQKKTLYNFVFFKKDEIMSYDISNHIFHLLYY